MQPADPVPVRKRAVIRPFRSRVALLVLTAWLGACASLPPDAPEPATPASDATAPESVAQAPADEKPKATAAASEDIGASDPLEGFNRAMYAFNDKLDVYVLKPVARTYREWVPDPVRKGVSNFISNLGEPIVIVNDLLQGKFQQALSDFGRFVTNTTMGLFGIFDPSTHVGLAKHNEDFGQTLGVWGVGEGPYIVWPLIGPSTFRDTGGDVADWYAYPPNYLDDKGDRNALYGVKVVDKREKLLDATDIIEQAAKEDPYVFVREAYRQRRKSLVYDGNPPREVPEGLFEDDGPPPAKPPAPP
jgi:phospholipid-binding lipoprotein MlaA